MDGPIHKGILPAFMLWCCAELLVIRHEHILSFLNIYTCANHITGHVSVFYVYLYSVNVYAHSVNINSEYRIMTFPVTHLRCCDSTKSNLRLLFHFFFFLQIFSVNMAYRDSKIPNSKSHDSFHEFVHVTFLHMLFAFFWVTLRRLNLYADVSEHSICSIFIGG